MVIDLVDKLVDRAIQLINHRQQEKRKIWDEYVEPLYELFEKVHADYLDTYREYKRRLGENDVDINSLINKMEEDNLFSQGLRNKLNIYVANSHDQTSDDILIFAHHIELYLGYWEGYNGLKTNKREWNKTQALRMPMISKLSSIRESSSIITATYDKYSGKGSLKLALVINVLNEQIESMQFYYGMVTDRYLDLKSKLKS